MKDSPPVGSWWAADKGQHQSHAGACSSRSGKARQSRWSVKYNGCM